MSDDRLHEVIQTALFCPMNDETDPDRIVWGLPLNLGGPPGSRKSSLVRQITDECALAYHNMSPGRVGEGGFGVIAAPCTDEQGRRYLDSLPRRWQLDMTAGVLLVDDHHLAAQGLTPAIMGLVLDRMLGDHELPGRVRPVLAHNPATSTPNGTPLDPAAANRMCHVTVTDPTWSQWTAYRRSKGNRRRQAVTTAADLETTVLGAWQAADDWAIGAISAFGRIKPNTLRAQPEDPSSEAASGAWASPRSWEMAERAMAVCKALGASAGTMHTLLAGCIGQQLADLLIDTIARAELPDPADILAGRIAWHVDIRRPDLTDAVCESVAAYVLDPAHLDRREGMRGEAWTFAAQLDKEQARDASASLKKALLTGGCLYPAHMAAEMAQAFAWIGQQQTAAKGAR
jgi:hypothetical protein